MNTDRNHHITDQQLLENFNADRDNQWLGILLQRYTLLLLGVCMKYMKNEEEARDAVQQVFLKAIIELQKYRVVYFKSWIYMVARNHCLMILRERHGRLVVGIDEKSIPETPETDHQKQPVDDLALDQLSAALKELNPEQLQCVTLFYLQKKSYQEISETTGFSLMQVKSYIQNGKRNLKIIIEKKMKPS